MTMRWPRNSLFNAELVHNIVPWPEIDDLEIAVAEYVDWYNQRRLYSQIGMIPPVEAETRFYSHQPVLTSEKRD